MRTAFLLLSLGVVAGCGAPAPARPDAENPRAAVSAVEYRSAFEGYRPFADPELADWRQANEGVGAAGAHGGHK